MKRIQKLFLALTFLMVFSALSAEAQIYVNVRPVVPAYVRVERPSPRHVWVDEEWVERDGRYVWGGGYWAEPPRPGYLWIGGFWRHGPRGDIWVHRHWDHGHRDHEHGRDHAYGHRDRD